MVVKADSPEAKRIKASLDKDTRDVADLWTECLRKYKGIVGEDLTLRFTSVQAMIDFGSTEMDNFHQFRHNKKKVDKLRTLFKENLGYIEKGAQQLVAAATPAFPPAAAIGTALTYMLSACRQVSADYDVVTVFFQDMNTFLQRITILETRLPKYPAYRNCLMDVFTSVLELCGFATKYIELGRFKKWILKMAGAEDGDISGARKKMDTSLAHLQDATEYAILGNTEMLRDMTAELQINLELQMRLMDEQKEMLDALLQGQEGVRSDIQKLLVLFEERRRRDDSSSSSSSTTRANKSGGQNKPPTSNRVRSFFDDTINPAHEYRNIMDSFIPETSTWVFDDPVWEAWVSQEPGKEAPRILAVSGPPGAGKSHLAASAYDQLIKRAEQDSSSGSSTCVVQFYFREMIKDLNEFHNAINWMVIQIAEQNAALCERICVEIQREDLDLDTWSWEDIWNHLIKPLFSVSATSASSSLLSSKSPTRLQVVWDGLDELEPDPNEKDELIQFWTSIKEATDDLNVTFFCTTRPTLDETLKGAGAHIISVTKEKQLPDLKVLIWNHLNNDSGLRKFSKYMKQRISSTLEEKSDGMLYAEHMLRQFNILGRELLVLKALEQHMPDSLEQMYDKMLADLLHHTGPAELQAMKTLLWWLAFSYRPLTLDECLALLELTTSNSFDLERELQGRQLAKFLRIGDLEERIDTASTTSTTTTIMTATMTQRSNLDTMNPTSAGEAPYSDVDLPLRFQERSMGGFFRSGRAGETGLRTPSATAHRLIFMVCSNILCSKAGFENVQDGLCKYAAGAWAYHMSWTILIKDSESDRIACLEALAAIMTNESNAAATRIESLGIDYDEIVLDFKDGLLVRNMSYSAGLIVALGEGDGEEKMRKTTMEWAKKVVESDNGDDSVAFVPLAKGHITNWLTAKDVWGALKSFKFAHSCLKLTKFKHLVKQDDDNEDHLDDATGENARYTKKEIIGVFQAFEDTPKDSNANWAVASLLTHSRHFTAALPYALHALEGEKQDSKDGHEDADHATRRFRTSNLLARIYLGKNDHKTANEAICEGLASAVKGQEEGKSPTIPAKLLRIGLLTRAKTEVGQGKIDDAIRSYEEARKADPENPMPGHNLKEEFHVYLDGKSDKEVIGLVKRWKPMERLAWMTWNFENDGYEEHEAFRRAAGRAGEETFMVEAYEEVIKLLDSLDAAAPIRYHLALAHWRVRNDADAAKALMNETLEASSSGRPAAFTEEDPATTLVCAVLLMTHIIYEEYRATSDPKVKESLFVEMKGLTKKNLVLSVSPRRSELMHHYLTLARMARKMASATEFQDTLQSVFDVCYEGLVDGVGWNDLLNLATMAIVLGNLKGLDREARILVSAQFSRLDPGVNDNALSDDDDDDDNEDEDEDEGDADDKREQEEAEGGNDDRKENPNNQKNVAEDDSDDGDLTAAWCTCDGECKPLVAWHSWTDMPAMYTCTVCSNVALCEPCYMKRIDYNNNTEDKDLNKSRVGSRYCGTNHTYIKGPIEGWKGIKDGVMRIETQAGEGGGEKNVEQVKFRDWLDELKDVKWKKAWDEFWLHEEH